jgi:hypothetical protein
LSLMDQRTLQANRNNIKCSSTMCSCSIRNFLEELGKIMVLYHDSRSLTALKVQNPNPLVCFELVTCTFSDPFKFSQDEFYLR